MTTKFQTRFADRAIALNSVLHALPACLPGRDRLLKSAAGILSWQFQNICLNSGLECWTCNWLSASALNSLCVLQRLSLSVQIKTREELAVHWSFHSCCPTAFSHLLYWPTAFILEMNCNTCAIPHICKPIMSKTQPALARCSNWVKATGQCRLQGWPGLYCHFWVTGEGDGVVFILLFVIWVSDFIFR